MNLLGANIPYPYDVPNRTTKDKIGYWSMVGFMELQTENAEGQSKNRKFTVDGTKAEKV
jgi:hypothetical protein